MHVHMFNFWLRKPILHCWEDIDAFHLLDDNIVDIILKMVITCMHVHDHGMHE